MRLALAVVMLLHGFAHIVGVIGAWDLAPSRVPHRTTLLGGAISAPPSVTQLMGVLWLVLALGFAATSAGAMANAGWWTKTALLFSALSLVLSVLSLPDARVGIPVNIAIIAAVAAGRVFGLL